MSGNRQPNDPAYRFHRAYLLIWSAGYFLAGIPMFVGGGLHDAFRGVHGFAWSLEATSVLQVSLALPMLLVGVGLGRRSWVSGILAAAVAVQFFRALMITVGIAVGIEGWEQLIFSAGFNTVVGGGHLVIARIPPQVRFDRRSVERARHLIDASLYDQMGPDRLAEAVKAFYARVLHDPALAPYFDGVDVTRIMQHQVRYLTATLGGPSQYDGRDLREAHAGMGITDDHYDRALDHFQTALATVGVAPSLADMLTDHVDGLRSNIVGV